MAQATVSVRLQVGAVDQTYSKTLNDAQTAALEKNLRRDDPSDDGDTPIEELYRDRLKTTHNDWIMRELKAGIAVETPWA